MPIPLAHPAAALPLRRFCPGHLSFSALIIGSLAPDFAYAIDDLNKFSRTVVYIFGARAEGFTCVKEGWDWDEFSHTLGGIIGFSLPTGFLALGVFLFLRSALVATLPNPHREVLQPLCSGPTHSIWHYFVSLVVGILTHLLWDSFTNAGHSLWQDWAFFHWHIAEFASNPIEAHRVIWFLSSIGGPIVLGATYLKFLSKKSTGLWVFNKTELPYYTLWAFITIISLLVALPPTLHFIAFGTSASALYNFLHRYIGYVVASFSCLVILIGFSATLWRAKRKAT